VSRVRRRFADLHKRHMVSVVRRHPVSVSEWRARRAVGSNRIRIYIRLFRASDGCGLENWIRTYIRSLRPSLASTADSERMPHAAAGSAWVVVPSPLILARRGPASGHLRSHDLLDLSFTEAAPLGLARPDPLHCPATCGLPAPAARAAPAEMAPALSIAARAERNADTAIMCRALSASRSARSSRCRTTLPSFRFPGLA
jgi:hypothetical protein